MASSMEQFWPMQHQQTQHQRAIMDCGFTYGQPQQFSPQDSIVEQAPPPIYIVNQNHNNNFYSQNAIYSGNQFATSTHNDLGGAQTGGQYDYYSGECGNSYPLPAYDHSGRHSLTSQRSPVSDAEYHHHQHQTTSTSTTTTTSYSDPYYLSPPHVNYPSQAGDHYQLPQQQYCQAPVYTADQQHAEPQLQTSEVFSDTTTCCPSSTEQYFQSQFAQTGNGKPEEPVPTNAGPVEAAEPVAVLDSTSGGTRRRTQERKIKQTKQSKQQQQQSEHLISSCHSNRVRVGPLGIIARRKNATRETTAILKEWLDEHGPNPYPTKGEKIMLSCVTKMSMTQVSTWFANARRRMKKELKNSLCSSSSSSSSSSSGSSASSAGSTRKQSAISSSLSKVKSEYAKAMLSSTTGCPALKYFMQKHHRQLLASSSSSSSLFAGGHALSQTCPDESFSLIESRAVKCDPDGHAHSSASVKIKRELGSSDESVQSSSGDN